MDIKEFENVDCNYSDEERSFGGDMESSICRMKDSKYSSDNDRDNSLLN